MPQRLIQRPFYPIVFVRGFASGMDEVDRTTATPYMGFNEGATMIRQLWTGEVVKHVFESPLVRLMKDHGYRDVYEAGLSAEGAIPAKSVVIHRYYEESSTDFGAGQKHAIEHYAQRLGELIDQLRDQVCQGDARARRDFRVYLVAHSMGGLICRCLLQNDQIGRPETKRLVDKVFTYATPHNGIDFQLLGNVPAFLSINHVNNFSRPRMARYLGLAADDRAAGRLARVDSLAGKFDPARFFCLVGTNFNDYTVAHGLSSLAVGPMSDGLVAIRNATVEGSPRAFVHRAHSGRFGILNAESGYQNLVRFLFGDVRVDGVLKVNGLTLPPAVYRKWEKNPDKRLRASYHFETVVRVRGARWDLHRRVAAEASAVFRKYEELQGADEALRHPHLFSTFLSASGWAKANARRPYLGFSIELRIRVPEFVLDGAFLLDDHHEGSNIFSDTILVDVAPPKGRAGRWRVRYGFDSSTPGRATRPLEVVPFEGGARLAIPVRQPNHPSIDAVLELTARPWNRS